jgi:tRNA(fMet)-specific endonuclease VapC
MNLLFDTNILFYISRDTSGYKVIEKMNPNNKIVYVSNANIAEIESISFQNSWNKTKIKRLELFLENVRIIEMSDTFIQTYVEIDAFSQRKHPNITEYLHNSPRNMGKHDLWIAATASLLNLQLVTTDQDFQHLEDTFLNLRLIKPEEIQKLY